ncbi:hypothetical protein COCMIDRAFT_107175 [Bipolaris oryzae ATCC 44560]|uniref:Rhodopsin domain-containing protein n=1 Tax=Bipolaris oryzae ATCC 44560 TaxID=930090 RepID=W6YZT8_COCMI|nr:uncharacterized protein COCMIDRAFT_107175 [Bipolaris oryzae ATCC 44560]EUC41054.1 hypothetical protein COCMIDRAFT_107175 [Bipolaris oryzae ATCC 44560]
MQLPPVSVVLSWPTPNYDDPVTRGPALVIVNAIFITLTLLILFAIGLTIVVLLANKSYGWDRHVWDIPVSKFVPTSKIAMAAKVVFTAAATFTRLSLHCFYYRLVSDSGKLWFRWLVHFNVFYTISIFVSFTCIAIFFCIPISNYWKLGAPPETCLDEGSVTLIVGIINCVADLLTTVTPIPLVLGLQMPLYQRLGVAFFFGMGFIVTGAGIVRTWFIYRSLYKEWDQTWYAYPLWIAAAVEIDLGVMCASAPVLKPLLAKIPWSLSGALTGGLSFKKSSLGTSKTLTGGQSAAFMSNRRSAAPQSVPELMYDKGHSYEMKNWEDAGPKQTNTDLERGNQETGPKDEERPKNGMMRWLQKLRPNCTATNNSRDMTITLTSQVELKSEPAASRAGPASRYRSFHENHMPLPPRRPERATPTDDRITKYDGWI